MKQSRKRKQRQRQSSPWPIKTPTKKAKIDGVVEGPITTGPYPDHPRPTSEECRAVRDDLLALHGFPEEFAKYRRRRPDIPSPTCNTVNPTMKSEPLDGEADGGSSAAPPEETVLDGLVSTILSQNTTDANSRRAFASLKSCFPTWEDVLAADSRLIQDAIRCGGLAPTKAACIKNIFNSLHLEKGKLCMEYLRDLSIDEIKAELSHFKGIGPKTVACVLMFQLQRDDLPVDRHVFHIAKTIGWLPEVADIKKAYLHLNQRIPDELKFDLNCLLFTHGKACKKCSKKRDNSQQKKSHVNSCPLLSYSKNSTIRIENSKNDEIENSLKL